MKTNTFYETLNAIMPDGNRYIGICVVKGTLTVDDLLAHEVERGYSNGNPDDFDVFEGRSDELGRLEYQRFDNREYYIDYLADQEDVDIPERWPDDELYW